MKYTMQLGGLSLLSCRNMLFLKYNYTIFVGGALGINMNLAIGVE